MNTRLIPRSLSAAARLTLAALALTPALLVAQQVADPAPQTQDGQGPHHGGHMDPAERQAHMLQRMTKQLNLSPDQVTQIKAIQADTVTQEQALHSDSSVAGADRHSRMMEIHKSEHDKISAVLTDDQRTKLAAMDEKRHDRMHENGSSDGPPPPAQ